jgi:folate-binding protein YgfZ
MTETPFTALVPRDLVIVRGPDATSFLQSLVSQDLDAIPVGESAPSLLLQPQGKLLVDFVALHAADDDWRLVCEGGFGPVLAEGLNRFKIRVKVEIETPTVAGLAVRGGSAPAVPPGCDVVAVPWNGGVAFDVVGPPDVIAALGLAVVSADEYERARIEAGVPRLGVDVDESTIPQEAGLELDAVSFTKGCFVGQELVCRIDTRGHVNRHLRRLRARSGTLPTGAEITFDGRPVGAVTSSVGDVALAMVRREVEAGTDVTVGAVGAVVETLVTD